MRSWNDVRTEVVAVIVRVLRVVAAIESSTLVAVWPRRRAQGSLLLILFKEVASLLCGRELL